MGLLFSFPFHFFYLNDFYFVSFFIHLHCVSFNIHCYLSESDKKCI